MTVKEQRISAIFEERFLESVGDYYYYFLLFNYKFEQSIPSLIKNKSLLIGTRNSFHANFVGKCQRSSYG